MYMMSIDIKNQVSKLLAGISDARPSTYDSVSLYWKDSSTLYMTNVTSNEYATKYLINAAQKDEHKITLSNNGVQDITIFNGQKLYLVFEK